MATRFLKSIRGGAAIVLAVAIGHPAARAEPCTTPTPACHLDNGKDLLSSDPRHAAEELLASYKLDERTDTLALYAIALAVDHRYALALETWKRVIVFRDSELEAAKDTVRTSTGRKRAAARAAVARAEQQSEQAAEAIIKLWPSVGRVHVRLAPGQQLAVSRDGAEVDISHDVLVNAGRDELVFTRKDGSVERVVVHVAAGATANVDAPPDTRPAAPAPRPESPPGQPERRERPLPIVRAPAPRPESPPPGEPAEPERPGRPALLVRAPGPRPASRPSEPGPSAPGPSAPGPSPGPSEPGPSAPGPSAPAPSAPGPSASGPSPGPSAGPLDDEPRSRAMSRVGLGVLAGAVVAEGIAGGLGYLASRDHDRAGEAGCSADGRCPFGPAADLAHQSNDRARLAQITAIGGAALAVTGVTLWLVGRKTRHAVADLALHVGPSSTAISGRF